MKLYKFWKEQCSGCNTISAILKTVDLPDSIELVEINVMLPENKHYITDFNLSSVPVLLFENGYRLNGATNKKAVLEFINNGIYNF